MLTCFSVLLIVLSLWWGLIKGTKLGSGFQARLRQLLGTLGIMGGLLILMVSSRTGVIWEAYSPEMIAAAQKSKRPVIIDFYADWCLPCLQLDEVTYADPAVARALDNFVKLKLDATDMSSADVIEANDYFEVIGLPTIVFLDPEGKEHAATRITGFISPEKMLELLHSERFKDLDLH